MPNMLKASNAPVLGILMDAALFSSRYPPLTIPTQRCRNRYRTSSVDGLTEPCTFFRYILSVKCEPWKIFYTLTQTYYLAVPKDLWTLVSSACILSLHKEQPMIFKNNLMSSLHSVVQEADIDSPPRCWYQICGLPTRVKRLWLKIRRYGSRITACMAIDSHILEIE